MRKLELRPEALASCAKRLFVWDFNRMLNVLLLVFAISTL
jgi:hypothetical protein